MGHGPHGHSSHNRSGSHGRWVKSVHLVSMCRSAICWANEKGTAGSSWGHSSLRKWANRSRQGNSFRWWAGKNSKLGAYRTSVNIKNGLNCPEWICRVRAAAPRGARASRLSQASFPKSVREYVPTGHQVTRPLNWDSM